MRSEGGGARVAPSDLPAAVDVVVVGAGFAGGAAARALASAGLSVVILERQHDHGDLVRGEWLNTWGVVEARRLGLEPTLQRAGANLIRWWHHWDETVGSTDAPVWDLSTFVQGVEGPLAFSHPRACAEMCADAEAAGARTVWGVRDIDLEQGTATTLVSWAAGDRRVGVRARYVLGAGGRSGPLRKLIGGEDGRFVHHWGGGLAVEGLHDWPSDVQAVGTEGRVMFFVFPQGGGRARLYLSYATEDRTRYTGLKGARNFLDAFDLPCLPYGKAVAEAVPAGPLATFPSSNTWSSVVRRGSVVLIGDEAGSINPVVGTGLASSLRDARLVAEAITGDDPEAGFDAYERERAERMRRLRITSDLQVTLMAEFGPEARQRRAEAWQRATDDNRLAALLMGTYVAPEHVPEFAFHPVVRERLVGRRLADRLHGLELAGV